MIPTTVSSSPSTATLSGSTSHNHNTSNNGQLNSFSTVTPTAGSIFATAISPQTTAQTSSIMLGLAALILEGRAVADDEFQPQLMRTNTAAAATAHIDANSFSGTGNVSGSGSGIGAGVISNTATNISLLASTSYGISSGSVSGMGSGAGGSGGCPLGVGGRQSPTCRPSTSRAAASGHVINITTNPYAFNNNNNNNSEFGAHMRDARPLYIDPYTSHNSSSDSASSSSAESTHQRWTQKLCQLRQVSPAAGLGTAYEQPVTVEAREPELVALAINESGASERAEFEIVRRTLLNRANLNAVNAASSGGGGGGVGGAGSASSSPSSGSGSENFLLSLQTLATTCLRSGSPSSIEPSGSGGSVGCATATPTCHRYSSAALSSPPPPPLQHISKYMYRANTPTIAQHRFHEPTHGSASSCGSGVQSPRPHWSTSAAAAAAVPSVPGAAATDNVSMWFNRGKYARHAANTGMSLGTGRIPIPGTAVNTSMAGALGSTTASAKLASAASAATPTTTSSKYPQQGPHCDQFLKKMGLAKGEAAEAEDHICDSSNLNLSCSRWRAYCNKIDVIMGRGEPVCIEVYLGPVNHKILLEQWILTQKEKAPSPTMTLPSLCSAIRSQLYFSQISAWCDLIKKSDKTIYDTGRVIYRAPTGAAGDLATPHGSSSNSGAGGGVGIGIGNGSGSGSVSGNASNNSGGIGSAGVIVNTNINLNITPGTSPNSTHTHNPLHNALLVLHERPRLNIYYRIKSFDSTACFNSKPNVHNFPNVNITENCSISVCLKSLPRINGGIPKIGTLMLANPTTAAAAATTTAAATAASASSAITTAATTTTAAAAVAAAAATTAIATTTAITMSMYMAAKKKYINDGKRERATTTITTTPTPTIETATSNGSKAQQYSMSFYRNGANSQHAADSKSSMLMDDTPRSSRATSRCGITATNLDVIARAEMAGSSSAALPTSTSAVAAATKPRVFIRDSYTACHNSNITATYSSTNSNAAMNESSINNACVATNGKRVSGGDGGRSDGGNNRGNSSDSQSNSHAQHNTNNSQLCTPKQKCMFFLGGEDEAYTLDEADDDVDDFDADVEAYIADVYDNRSDTANSSIGADSQNSMNAFSSNAANMSHREKQLMKYRKRMLKRDKKHQRKPLSFSAATTEFEQQQQQHQQQRARHEAASEQQRTAAAATANCCQPMEEGCEDDVVDADDDDAVAKCYSLNSAHSPANSTTQIEMISTGTQTPASCCRQCGAEKTLICLRCTAGNNEQQQHRRRQQQQHQQQQQQIRQQAAVNRDAISDDMDDSTASSISSSEIIRTPRNKAEMLLQAIQRTPKVAASKHKKQEPRHPSGGGGSDREKAQNNNQLKNGASTLDNGNGYSAAAGCQVCKRQKMQHNFGNRNASSVQLNGGGGASAQLAVERGSSFEDVDGGGDDDDDIGDDTDDDGGRKHIQQKATNASENLSTPLSVLAPSAEVMQEESFISSTKLTPQIDRCTLNSAEASGKAVGDRSGNRTPPTITTTTYMEDGSEYFDESQFKTPPTNSSNSNNTNTNTSSVGAGGIRAQHPHKQTPKPNLLQLHCNYVVGDVGNGSENVLQAAGDGFVKMSSTAKPQKQSQKQQQGDAATYNALLLRKGLPKVNLTPIFCNPMPPTTSNAAYNNHHHSSPIPIHGSAAMHNDDATATATTFSFEPTLAVLGISSHHLQLHHQLMQSSSGHFSDSPSPISSSTTATTINTTTTTEANNIPVQKSFSAPTLPNSPSLSPRFAKQAAIYKRRSRHLSDRSDRSSLGSDEQFSDEDLESGGMYSPATSPLKQCARVAACFGRLPLLGNLEESLLQKRLVPKVEVMGFKVLLGASGGFCPTQLTIPAAAYLYELQGETLSTPYVCEIRLPRKGYSVPRAGTVQATLLNPMGTVVRMFVIPYDMRDMPPLHQTFIRQRILAESSCNDVTNAPNVQGAGNKNIKSQNDGANGHMAAYTNGFGAGGDETMASINNSNDYYNNNNNNAAKNKYRLSPSGSLQGENNLGHFISAEHMKRLRYSIHLRFQTSRSGRLSLHTDIRLLISRRTEYDTAAAHAKGVLEAPNDLVTDTFMPSNPRYSARQDLSGSGSGSSNGNVGGGGVGSGGGGGDGNSTCTNIIVPAAMSTNSHCSSTNGTLLSTSSSAAAAAAGKAITNNNNNNTGDNDISKI